MIVIQASNIHMGGGAVLLTDLLSTLEAENVKVKLFVDSRYNCDSNENLEVNSVKASIFNRFKVELLLKNIARWNKNSTLLFFGNLPPLFKSNKNAHLFFQNLILLNESNSFSFGICEKLKHFVERLWLKIGLKNINTVYVQSESVKRLFLRKFPNAQVKVFAFANLKQIPNSNKIDHGFIYVASADPHKNHLMLIKAWIYLFENDIKPKLTLTTLHFSKKVKNIYILALKKGVNIEVKPNLSHKDVLKLYSSAQALIYPSLTESFGLPLLEAKQVGLPIIASELDYVRDLVDPIQTFDPKSEVSIARAVQRFLNVHESAKTEVKAISYFIKEILLR